MIMINNTSRIETYFPITICQKLTGLVLNISNVPLFISSDMDRMAIAGTKKINTHGANSKKLSKEAYPKSKILLSFNTNKNTPFTSKNRMMAI